MSSPESVQIRSYLLAGQAARQDAPQPSLAEQRTDYELLVEGYVGHPVPLPEGTRIEAVDVDGLPAEWISPPDADAERVVLYLHGGGYIIGSLKSHRDLVARLATASGMRSLLFEYRLAPEHVFPAAIDDALTAYHWLLANGTKPEHIVLAGDSAGGGLILALLQTLRDRNSVMPGGQYSFRPGRTWLVRLRAGRRVKLSIPSFLHRPLTFWRASMLARKINTIHSFPRFTQTCTASHLCVLMSVVMKSCWMMPCRSPNVPEPYTSRSN
ncbi:hypothetical protein KDK_57090 [Dictyobacter kobayashii]|uniref:Alpha/beta hydrolase fold-3 domain-containing protein n=1 Tax=Dictyobacter kobayashii TaxID=2014872 RepID=A0A402AS38_9CHLR|nr:alpha/beta hydrolase [Dictyobacter kobayashii]GCE21909.1 hypothetical protein KDK_57090 [Dictyobacter kobayashii]